MPQHPGAPGGYCTMYLRQHCLPVTTHKIWNTYVGLNLPLPGLSLGHLHLGKGNAVAVIQDQKWIAVNWQGPFATVINPLSHTASRYFLCHRYFYFFTNKDCRLQFAPAHIRLDSRLWQGEWHKETFLSTGWKLYPRFCTVLKLLQNVCWCWSTNQHKELMWY